MIGGLIGTRVDVIVEKEVDDSVNEESSRATNEKDGAEESHSLSDFGFHCSVAAGTGDDPSFDAVVEAFTAQTALVGVMALGNVDDNGREINGEQINEQERQDCDENAREGNGPEN